MTNYEKIKCYGKGNSQGQKEQAKQDLVDALKKFELTLHHLKKAGNNEKDEQETNLNELWCRLKKISKSNSGYQ